MESLDPAQRSRVVEILQRQSAQMVHLVDDLLDLARISRGVITLRREPLDLVGVVRSAIEARTSLVGAPAHRLRLELPERGPIVLGDPARLAQIFDNILDNAEKYTPAGGVISVSLQSLGESARISIQDTGVGIPPERLDDVFGLFTQLDRTAERRGLGIGLALVRRLITLHGGTVTARSDGPGSGTRIDVVLPVIEPRPAEVTGARRILVVDDQLGATDSIARRLVLEGHDVRATHDGLAAVEIAASFRPDVVLVDLERPELDGVETARRLRTECGPRTKLVALSTWDPPAEYDAHLVRPVELAELFALLG
jgi:CheY-like chemotaxis protein